MPRWSRVSFGAVMIVVCLACSERAQGETVTFTFTFSGTVNNAGMLSFAGLSGETAAVWLSFSVNADADASFKSGPRATYQQVIESGVLRLGSATFSADKFAYSRLAIEDGTVFDEDDRALDLYQILFTTTSPGQPEVSLSLRGPYLLAGTDIPSDLNITGATATLGLGGYGASVEEFSSAAVPTPAAALAGPVLLGLTALRRRRV